MHASLGLRTRVDAVRELRGGGRDWVGGWKGRTEEAGLRLGLVPSPNQFRPRWNELSSADDAHSTAGGSKRQEDEGVQDALVVHRSAKTVQNTAQGSFEQDDEDLSDLGQRLTSSGARGEGTHEQQDDEPDDGAHRPVLFGLPREPVQPTPGAVQPASRPVQAVVEVLEQGFLRLELGRDVERKVALAGDGEGERVERAVLVYGVEADCES